MGKNHVKWLSFYKTWKINFRYVLICTSPNNHQVHLEFSNLSLGWGYEVFERFCICTVWFTALMLNVHFARQLVVYFARGLIAHFAQRLIVHFTRRLIIHIARRLYRSFRPKAHRSFRPSAHRFLSQNIYNTGDTKGVKLADVNITWRQITSSQKKVKGTKSRDKPMVGNRKFRSKTTTITTENNICSPCASRGATAEVTTEYFPPQTRRYGSINVTFRSTFEAPLLSLV